jgi:transcriptional regulator with XRE-family HTH domain
MPRKATANPLGEFIRNQREIARLSLRQFANLAHISNPYLSQIERGLYEPSASVLKAIATALDIPPERLYAVAGWFEPVSSDKHEVETAVRTDSRLTDSQKEALIAVYRGFLNQAREK